MGGIAKKQGQTTFEYISVGILVIVGIIFMGGYVHRAINAYFHDAETQVEDSYNEKFERQAPEDASLTIPGCSCTPITPPVRTCGGICLSTQIQERYEDCSSSHCGGLGVGIRCLNETASANPTWDSCFVSKGGYPKGTDSLTAIHFTPATGYADWNTCGQYNCCTAPTWSGICGEPGTTYDGYGLYDRYCGGIAAENWQPFWIQDAANCSYNCAILINSNQAQWCDVTQHNTNLSADTEVRYVNDCSGADVATLGSPYTESKCLAECKPPYVANAALTGCEHCPNGACEAALGEDCWSCATDCGTCVVDCVSFTALLQGDDNAYMRLDRTTGVLTTGAISGNACGLGMITITYLNGADKSYAIPGSWVAAGTYTLVIPGDWSDITGMTTAITSFTRDTVTAYNAANVIGFTWDDIGPGGSVYWTATVTCTH